MKKIRLYYWNEQHNFGDCLAPQLVEELSSIPVEYEKPVEPLKFIDSIWYLASIILKGKYHRWERLIAPYRTIILSVGSILQFSNKRCKVWGSGYMNYYERPVRGKIYALRGKETKRKLIEQGIKLGDIPLGDPALLLPLWLQAKNQPQNELGIIPHWKETDYFIDLLKSKGLNKIKLIDLRTDNIQKVVDEINSCKYILSTSLHGIIVAHAYNIPALWIKYGYIDTDGFKFKDYFSSVGIDYYDGFDSINDIISSTESYQSLFAKHSDKSRINVSLQQIQMNLLKSAPFPLNKRYKRLLTTLKL